MHKLLQPLSSGMEVGMGDVVGFGGGGGTVEDIS